MIDKNDVFLYIAKDIEGIRTVNKGKTVTRVYGFGAKESPLEYSTLKKVIGKNDDKQDEAILNTYNKVYKESIAEKLPRKLGYMYFMAYLIDETLAISVLHKVLIDMFKSNIIINGILDTTTKTAIDNISKIYHPMFADISAISYMFYIQEEYLGIRQTRTGCDYIEKIVKLGKYLFI
jgi:hypothetical protein